MFHVLWKDEKIDQTYHYGPTYMETGSIIYGVAKQEFRFVDEVVVDLDWLAT